MLRKIKKLAIFTTLLVVVLSTLGLAKYGDIELGYAADTGHKLTLRLPDLTHLSAYLNGCEYQFNIEKVCVLAFLLLLLISRGLLIRRIST